MCCVPLTDGATDKGWVLLREKLFRCPHGHLPLRTVGTSWTIEKHQQVLHFVFVRCIHGTASYGPVKFHSLKRKSTSSLWSTYGMVDCFHHPLHSQNQSADIQGLNIPSPKPQGALTNKRWSLSPSAQTEQAYTEMGAPGSLYWQTGRQASRQTESSSLLSPKWAWTGI